MELLSSITYYSFSALLNLTISLILALVVLKNNTKPFVNKIFTALMFSVALWSIFYFLWLNTPDKNLADFYMRICMIPVLFMGTFYTHFVISILKKEWPRSLIIGNYLIRSLVATAVYTPLYAKEGGAYMSFSYWPLPGPLFHIHLLHFSLNVLYSNYLLYRSIKETDGIFRNQLLYFLVGSAIGFTAGMTNYFFWYRIPIPPILNIFVSLYAPCYSYAIIKYRLMEINIVFKKGAVYAIGLFLVLTPTYFILLWTQNIFFKTVNIPYSLIIFSLLILATVAFYKIKSKIEITIEKSLFSNKYDPYKILTNFSKDMVSVLTLDELLDKTINTFVETLKIKKASIFLFDEEKKNYEMKASFGLDEEKNKFKIKQDVPLINYFVEKEDVAIREEIERYPSTQQTQDMIKILKDMESEIAIPFMEKDKIVGFCNLSAKGDRSMYSHEDIELFLSLGHQAAIAIKNALLVEKIKESKHIIRRMERLKTIGAMAAGLAHEIRNPLVPIQP